jgi:RHS repeat-associated protein
VPAAELDDQGRLKTRFVYGKHRHAPLYLITYAGGVQTGVYRLICDQTGSVRLVVNTATGIVAQRLDYDEFGRLLADSNPGFQPFGFAGGLWDADTGLVHLGAREYDPQTGRFITPDPTGFRGGLNLYGYVMNDPVNLIDPSGLGPDQVDFTRDWSLSTCLVCGSNGGRWARLHDDGAAGRVKNWLPPPIDLTPAEGAEDDDTWDDPMNDTPGPIVPAWPQNGTDLPENPLYP